MAGGLPRDSDNGVTGPDRTDPESAGGGDMTTETSGSSAWLDSLPYRIWRANQTLTRQVTAAVDDLGVTVTQLGIAVHLDELGHMSASDLARLFHLTPQSVTTALNRLEQIGWVERRPHPVHRRIVLYEVTPTGLENVERGRERVAAINHSVEVLLSDEERAHLVSALTAITTSGGDEVLAPRLRGSARSDG